VASHVNFIRYLRKKKYQSLAVSSKKKKERKEKKKKEKGTLAHSVRPVLPVPKLDKDITRKITIGQYPS